MMFKPLCAALVMGAVTIVFYNMMSGFMPGSRLVTLAAIAVGAVVYLLAVIAVKGIKREDVLNMPKGEKIAGILTKYKLL